MTKYTKKCTCVHGTMVLRVGGYFLCELCGNKDGNQNLAEKQVKLNNEEV